MGMGSIAASRYSTPRGKRKHIIEAIRLLGCQFWKVSDENPAPTTSATEENLPSADAVELWSSAARELVVQSGRNLIGWDKGRTRPYDLILECR
jgi:hypothetical protein